jgi:hypothetical protein
LIWLIIKLLVVKSQERILRPFLHVHLNTALRPAFWEWLTTLVYRAPVLLIASSCPRAEAKIERKHFKTTSPHRWPIHIVGGC